MSSMRQRLIVMYLNINSASIILSAPPSTGIRLSGRYDIPVTRARLISSPPPRQRQHNNRTTHVTHIGLAGRAGRYRRPGTFDPGVRASVSARDRWSVYDTQGEQRDRCVVFVVVSKRAPFARVCSMRKKPHEFAVKSRSRHAADSVRFRLKRKATPIADSYVSFHVHV